jgi:hypothetical protein
MEETMLIIHRGEGEGVFQKTPPAKFSKNQNKLVNKNAIKSKIGNPLSILS